MFSSVDNKSIPAQYICDYFLPHLFSLVFIYSMPGYSVSVKERMLYSSCKATLLGGCEDVLKMEVTKKVRRDDIRGEVY